MVESFEPLANTIRNIPGIKNLDTGLYSEESLQCTRCKKWFDPFPSPITGKLIHEAALKVYGVCENCRRHLEAQSEKNKIRTELGAHLLKTCGLTNGLSVIDKTLFDNRVVESVDRFVMNPHPLWIYGGDGVGKSSLAAYITKRLCLQGYRSGWFNGRDVMSRISSAYHEQGMAKLVREVTGISFPVIDDWMGFGLTETHMNFYETVFDYQDQKQITAIVTSKAPPESTIVALTQSYGTCALSNRLLVYTRKMNQWLLDGEDHRQAQVDPAADPDLDPEFASADRVDWKPPF